MRKNFWMFAGFLLFVFGFLSLVLSMIGVQFAFLTWMDQPGRLFGFVLRLVFIITGVLMVIMASTDWDREMAESSAE